MLKATSLIGFGDKRRIIPAVPPTLTYIGSNSSTVDTETYDFGNFNAPTAGLMIVGVAARHGTTGPQQVNGNISIGGIAGTKHINPSNAARMIVCIASRSVSSGNNHVTVDFTGTAQTPARCAVAVWLLTGHLSDTPVDFDGTNTATTATSGVATLDIPALGVAVFAHCHDNNNGNTWATASERADLSVESFVHGFSDIASTLGVTNHAESVSWTGAAKYGIAGVSWG